MLPILHLEDKKSIEKKKIEQSLDLDKIKRNMKFSLH